MEHIHLFLTSFAATRSQFPAFASQNIITRHETTAVFPSSPCFSFTIANAQSPAPAPAEQNDPGAKKILDKIRKKYEGYKTLEAAFTLTIEVPGQAKEIQKGTVGPGGRQIPADYGSASHCQRRQGNLGVPKEKQRSTDQ